MITAALRCWWRGMHNAYRHPLGGQRCIDCGFVGADLDEMGRGGAGYQLSAMRMGRDVEGNFVRRVGW